MLLGIMALAAAGNWNPPSDLGVIPADNVRLVDSPKLAYLADALPEGSLKRVSDLFETMPIFSHAPDPTALLQATQAANASHANQGPLLKMLTYNVALLDANVFWLIPYRQTPYLKERRDELPKLILSKGYDVVVLQEVWRRQDRLRFEAEAEAQGYQAFHGPRGSYNDGLLTLIKSKLIEGEAAVHAEPYEARDHQENFPGPGIKRGFVEVAFESPGLGMIRVYNTHLLAWPANWGVRMSEVRQLGDRITRQNAAVQSPQGALALLGGDLNGGAYYPSDTWLNPEGEVEKNWWGNAVSYGLLQHYGALSDLYVQGGSVAAATEDIRLGQLLQSLTPAAGRPDVGGTCTQMGYPAQLTVSDCNILYGMQYKDTEYPARIDHLMAYDPDGRIFASAPSTAFTERQAFDGSTPMEPSDHLGVAVTLQIRPQ
jgi:endonuclease/exonuclease/phosphatase family metal-dependent hydrolase